MSAQPFPPELSRRWAERLRAQGNYTEIFELQGTSGHLDGIFVINQAADTIRAFLEKLSAKYPAALSLGRRIPTPAST